MTFLGWPEEALDFYEGLEDDNSKAYWTAHKATYDIAVLGPMTDLTDELAAEFGPAKIFRPNRDIRFSADKSPYKTEIGATIGTGYVRLSAAGLAAGNGMYLLAPDQLDRYRQAVDGDVTGRELERVVRDVTGAPKTGSTATGGGITLLGHDKLKTAPRGFATDHRRIDLLRHKGLAAWQEWPVEAWLGTPAARERVSEFLRTTQPLADWLSTHVGPSSAEQRRR